jgi:hypothetical protein
MLRAFLFLFLFLFFIFFCKYALEEEKKQNKFTMWTNKMRMKMTRKKAPI